MKAVQNKQNTSNKTFNQLKPQSNQSAKTTDTSQSLSKVNLPSQKTFTEKIEDGSKISQYRQQKPIQNLLQKNLNQKAFNQTLLFSPNQQNLPGEQNQRLKFDFQQLFGSKKLYKPITLLNQSFTQSIGKGIISINQQKQGLKDFGKELICFKKQQKQNDQIQKQQLKRIKEIQRKKNQILNQLKSLYQDQQKLRAKQKFILLKRKVQHQFISNHSTQQNETVPTLSLKSPKKLKTLNNQSPKSPLQTKKIEQKSKSLPRSIFTEEQKKAINQIIRKKNQQQIKQKQKLQKLFNQLDLEQKQLLENEKLTIEAQRQQRKKQALQRLIRQKNSRSGFIMNSRQKIHTEPNQVKDNEFITSNHNEQPQSSSLSRLNYSPKKNYSYLNYQQLDQQKLKEQTEHSRYLLTKRKQQTKTDFQSIKVHLNNYRSIKNHQSQIQKQKIQNFKLQQKQRIKSIRQKYGFMTKIKETLLQQERHSIQKYQQQISRKVSYQKRMKDYFYSIPNKPKLRCRSNLVQNRSISTNSQANFRIRSSKNLYQNGETFQFKNNTISDKYIELQKQKDKDEDNQFPLKIDKQKIFISGTLELEKISHNALTKRKIQLKESIQKKQREMIRILKKDQSSLKDIKKALQIFYQLDSQTQPEQTHKRKSHTKQVGW